MVTASDPQARDWRWGYFLLLILVNFLWAFQYSGARIATRKLGPFTVTFLPMALATLVLGGLLVVSRRNKGNTGHQRGGAGHPLPVFGVLISTVALKESVTGRLLIGGLLVFIAAFLATTYTERKSLARPTTVGNGSPPIPTGSKERFEC
jgi:drug/metabolite transporter (DMT)-like permease